MPGKSQTNFNDVGSKKKEIVLDKYRTIHIHNIEYRIFSLVKIQHLQNMIMC